MVNNFAYSFIAASIKKIIQLVRNKKTAFHKIPYIRKHIIKTCCYA